MIDEGLSYVRQRAVFRDTGSFEEVVRSMSLALVRETNKEPARITGE